MVEVDETREECNMEKHTVAKYLIQLLTDKELEYKKEFYFNECKGSQLVLLWRILFVRKQQHSGGNNVQRISM